MFPKKLKMSSSIGHQSPTTSTRPSVSPANCIIHNIIQNHNGEVRKILREARDVNKRPPPPPNFRQIPICSIGHPQSLTPFTLESNESQFAQDCPEWKTESAAVPPYDLYFDKLVTMRTPYIRAQDLEELFKRLKNSTPNVQTKDVSQLSDPDVVNWCRDEIWKNQQPIVNSKDMSFGNARRLKQVETSIKRKIEIETTNVMADIRTQNTQQQTVNDIQEKMIDVLIRESKTWGYYSNRCGEMGEVAVKQSIHKALSKKNIPSLTLSGFRISKYLGESLAKVGVSLQEDAEMDTASFIPNGDKVNINFIQTKVLFPSESEAKFEEKIKDKIKYSLEQTTRDLKALLAVMPDISGSQLDKLNIATFSALPITQRTDNICDACAKIIIFKEDLLTPVIPAIQGESQSLTQTLWDLLQTDKESISKIIMEVVEAQPAASGLGLVNKLELNTIQPPTQGSLELYKKMSSRYIGMASLHPMKDYSTFLGKQEKQLEDLKKLVKRDTQRALFITNEQNAAIQNEEFILHGTFGVGKTTVLELCLLNILEKAKKNNEPCQVVLIVWDNSHDLVDRFKNIANGNNGVKVFTREEAFNFFGAEQDEKSRVTEVNNLCEKIAHKLKVSATDKVFLITDEMNPNPIVNDPENFDWRGITSRGVRVMLSLKPVTSLHTSNPSTAQVLSPAHLPTIHLHRVLRCTQSILNLVHGLIKALQADSRYGPPNTNFPMDLVTPGHEIHGEMPEYVELPECSCGGLCRSPVEHLVTRHYPTLQAILARLVTGHNIPQQHITILIYTYSDTAAAKAWLVGRLGGEYSGVHVKLLEEFRGMESPVLLFINDDGGSSLSATLEGITRVTSRVFVVQKRERDALNDFSAMLRQLCVSGLAVNTTGLYSQTTPNPPQP